MARGVDIHYEWEILVHRKPNAGEILAFAVWLVKEYQEIADEKDREAINKFRKEVMKSPTYPTFISNCMDFILEQTGIQLKYPEWAL